MRLNEIYDAVCSVTMVSEAGVRFAMKSAIAAVNLGLRGAIVECGVWRGGCSIAMMLAHVSEFGSIRRPFHLLDSFAGLPPVTERDGSAARAWQADKTSARYHDNCRASEQELRQAIRSFGIADTEYVVWPGWFQDTLQKFSTRDERISLLRLDCDWYDSTKLCLDILIPKVCAGGVVIVDDYYAWDGCTRAVHDYFSNHDLPYRLKSIDDCAGAYFVKEDK